MDVIPQPESLKDCQIPHKVIDIRNNELLKKEIGIPKLIIFNIYMKFQTKVISR